MYRQNKNLKIVLLAAGVLALCLPGCGKAEEKPVQESSVIEAVAVSAAPTETVTPTPTAEPTATPSPTATPTATPTPTETPTPTPEEEVIEKYIGQKTEDETWVHVILENAAGTDIVQVSVLDDMTDLPIEMLLQEGDVFAAGEKRILYYDPKPAEEEAARRNAEAAEGTAEVTPAYTLRITDAGGQVYDLHGFTFADMKEGHIRLEEGVAYLTYISQETGQEVNTKEAELAEKARREAEQAAGQDAAYQEPVYQEPVYQEPVYQEPVYQEPANPEPVYEAPVVDAGGDDQCIADGLTY